MPFTKRKFTNRFVKPIADIKFSRLHYSKNLRSHFLLCNITWNIASWISEQVSRKWKHIMEDKTGLFKLCSSSHSSSVVRTPFSAKYCILIFFDNSVFPRPTEYTKLWNITQSDISNINIQHCLPVLLHFDSTSLKNLYRGSSAGWGGLSGAELMFEGGGLSGYRLTYRKISRFSLN